MAATHQRIGSSNGSYKHGKHGSPEYLTWRRIIARCYNKNDKNYAHYGALGIIVCDSWRGQNGFINFYADMGIRPAGCSIDRIDNTIGYSKGNCRWANNRTQTRNRRCTIKLTIDGIERPLQEWSELSNTKYSVIWDRKFKLGWVDNEAVFGRSK